MDRSVSKDLDMNKVSIIVPVYNLENSIERCIKSIINQSYTELELILVDDGSGDQSLGICEAYKKIDSRIIVLHHENAGVSYTRNCGIEIATGDYLMFVDGDDTICTDCIERYVKEATDNNVDVVIGGITFALDNGEIKELMPEAEQNFEKNIWECICKDSSGVYGYVSNKLYRLSIIRENQIRFNVDMVAQEDLDFALSVFDKCNYFRTIQYSGYNYFYIASRKKHPYYQYIGNKLKMLDYSQNYEKIGEECKEKIIHDIEGLLYVAFYEATIKEFRTVYNCYCEIEGLKDTLCKYSRCRFVTRLFKCNQYMLLMGYFFVRKSISRIIHK